MAAAGGLAMTRGTNHDDSYSQGLVIAFRMITVAIGITVSYYYLLNRGFELIDRSDYLDLVYSSTRLVERREQHCLLSDHFSNARTWVPHCKLHEPSTSRAQAEVLGQIVIAFALANLAVRRDHAHSRKTVQQPTKPLKPYNPLQLTHPLSFR